jgi:sugar lactone lactonase YvrE
LQAAALSTVEFEFVGGSHCLLGESPVWDTKLDCLWWLDIEGYRVFCWYPDLNSAKSWKTPEMPGFIVLTSTGLPAVGMETGIFVFDPDSGKFLRIVTLDVSGVRYNDATVDGFGRLWTGTMDVHGDQPCGSLFCIGTDLNAALVLSGLCRPNGLAADDRLARLYLSDSHPDIQSVWTFELDSLSLRLGDRRLFADFSDRSGRPDGAAIDANGNYWIAAINGARILVFAPDGRNLSEIATPFRDPTKPAFGGGRLDLLFVTSKENEKTGDAGHVAFARSSPERRFLGRASHCWNIPEHFR